MITVLYPAKTGENHRDHAQVPSVAVLRRRVLGAAPHRPHLPQSPRVCRGRAGRPCGNDMNATSLLKEQQQTHAHAVVRGPAACHGTRARCTGARAARTGLAAGTGLAGGGTGLAGGGTGLAGAGLDSGRDWRGRTGPTGWRTGLREGAGRDWTGTGTGGGRGTGLTARDVGCAAPPVLPGCGAVNAGTGRPENRAARTAPFWWPAVSVLATEGNRADGRDTPRRRT